MPKVDEKKWVDEIPAVAEADGKPVVVFVQQVATPAVLGVAAAAHYCGVSEKQWRRWTEAGKNPAPTKLDKCHRWARATLDAWVTMGMPPRAEFERKMHRSREDAARGRVAG